MNKRTFLSLLAAVVLAPRSLFAAKPRPLRIFWVDEDTEIFCAPDIAAINKYLGRRRAGCFQMAEDSHHICRLEFGHSGPCDQVDRRDYPELWLSSFEEPMLTEANRGEVWDYASEGEMIRDEDGSARTAREWAAEMVGVPWFEKEGRVCQLSTCYN